MMGSDVVSLDALAPAFPEIVVAVGALALLLLGIAFRRERSTLIGGLAVLLLVATLLMVVFQGDGGVLFSGGFIADEFARYMKALVLGGAAFVLILSLPNAEDYGLDKFEYPVLVLLATLGMMIMVSANDLMTLYVGLELHSLALYVVAAMKRTDTRATEAGLKYFVLGALASGMLLYGASLLYGFTGTTQLDKIVGMIVIGERSIGQIFGMVFLLVGIAFKISAVPFHMWTPDVYEGAPTPVTAFFATAPKVAAMALFVRVVTVSFAPIAYDWQQIVIFLSLASMVLGAFAAIGQKNFKRLIAYSAIGHIGFTLVGLSSATAVGVEGVALYMSIYMVITIGVFAALLAIRTDSGPVESIADMAGLAQKRPLVAGTMAVMMFALVGLPPLAGFFAKWHVFLAAIEANLIVLAVIGVLASAVSSFYYLRVVKVMYFDEPVQEFAAVPRVLTAVMLLSAFLVITYFFTVGSPLTAAAHSAAGSLF